MKNNRVRFLVIFALLILLAVSVYAVFPSPQEQDLYNGLIRLHVLANSDSDEDQALKLLVRDAVLEEVTEITADCSDVESAYQLLAASVDRLTATARAVIDGEGKSDPVSVCLGVESYPTREYDGIRLPAGDYRSLRVCIGQAEGHNWWCVLFPPLCVNSAAPDQQLLAAGFTPGQVRILTESDNPRYVLKFRILELISSWRR